MLFFRLFFYFSLFFNILNASPIVLDIPLMVAGYGSDFFKETANEFEKIRPNVRVNIHGDPRINDRVRIRVMAGDFPSATDAVLLYQNLIKSDKLVDLTDALNEPNWDNTGKWRDDFRVGVLDRWSFSDFSEGKLKTSTYGLPFAHAIWVLFYDKARFRREGWLPPKTWDDFFKLSKLIEAKGCATLSIPGLSMRYGDAILRSGFYNLVGDKAYFAYINLDPGTRLDSNFIKAADLLARISTGHLIRGWEGMTHTAAQIEFLEGRCAMTLSASWFVNEMRGRIPDGFELGAINLPVFSEGVESSTTLQAQSGYFFLFRSGDLAKDQATIDFFRYLTSRSRVKRFIELTDSPVALRNSKPLDYSSLMSDTVALLSNSSKSIDSAPSILVPSQGILSQAFTDARYKLMTGRIQASEFGYRLESAAQAERMSLLKPEHINRRHLLPAILLVGFILLFVILLSKPLWNPSTSIRNFCFSGFYNFRFFIFFVSPSFLIYSTFVLLPAIAAFGFSFFRWSGFGAPEWVGLLNFKWLLVESDVFWSALSNNAFLMFAPPLLVVPTSLALAAYIHRGCIGSGLIRLIVLFPNLLGGIAAALIWMAAYEPTSGFVNATFSTFGDLLSFFKAPTSFVEWFHGFRGHAWLTQSELYVSILPIYLWMASGFNLILYLAAMQGVPDELYEAAELDGATRLRQFFLITLPQIRGVLSVSAVFLVIGGLNAFELVWLLTGQEPTIRTHTLGTFMVGTMFSDFQVGRSAAISVVLFCLVLIGSLTVLRFNRAEENEL